MEAAEKAGDLKTARALAEHLLAQAAKADSERASLQLAQRISAAQSL